MTRPSPGLQVKKLKCEGCYLNKVSIYMRIKEKLCLFKSPLHACLTNVKNIYFFWLVCFK